MAQGKQPTHTVSAKAGRTDGEGKNIYVNCGAGWETERGIALRINSLPVPFDGSLYVNPIKED